MLLSNLNPENKSCRCLNLPQIALRYLALRTTHQVSHGSRNVKIGSHCISYTNYKSIIMKFKGVAQIHLAKFLLLRLGNIIHLISYPYARKYSFKSSNSYKSHLGGMQFHHRIRLIKISIIPRTDRTNHSICNSHSMDLCKRFTLRCGLFWLDTLIVQLTNLPWT